MKSKILPLIFVASLLSTGEATLKIYPFFFIVFTVIFIASKLRIKKSLAFPVALFVLTATTFSFIHLEKSFDLASQLKLIINLVFLISAGSYFLSISGEKSLQLLRVSSFSFIALSFIQALIIVNANSLWLLPLSLENSTSSYAIQDSIIFFGEQSKNIWASKISIFFIILFCCQYLDKKRNPAYAATYFFAAFCLLYINSRTAQLATIFFLLVMLYYHFWIVKKQKFILTLLGIILFPILAYTLQKLIRIDYSTIANFNPTLSSHMGDGLLSRIIIWSHVLNSTNISDYLFGNGILSFSYYTGNMFVENNPHNIFFSIVLDFGLLTFTLYSFMLYTIFKGSTLSRLLFIPFMIFASSQYLGYDSDLVIYFLLLISIQRNFIENRESTYISSNLLTPLGTR